MLLRISTFVRITLTRSEKKNPRFIKAICGFVVVVKKIKLALLHVLPRSCYDAILFLNPTNKIKIYKHVSIVNFHLVFFSKVDIGDQTCNHLFFGSENKKI